MAKFSNRHVSNYHMHILKMARPFIVDMHAHTHPWDVCYRADLLFSIFVPRMEQVWALGLSWCSRVYCSSQFCFRLASKSLQAGEEEISFSLAVVQTSGLQ